jgi:ABC-type multidrug transport system fused ATPase/permease subunit
MDNDFSVLEVFFSMLYFFLFIAWIYLLIVIATDIFRSRDMGGWGKALWILFLVILPIIGSLVYLIARGRSMSERQSQDYMRREQAFRSYVQDAAGGSTSTADELEKLAQLRDAGTISSEEFDAQKAKLLA